MPGVEMYRDGEKTDNGYSEKENDHTFSAPTFHEFLSATHAQKLLVPFFFSLFDFIGGLLFRWFGFQPYKFDEEKVMAQACKTTGFRLKKSDPEIYEYREKDTMNLT